MSDSVSAINKIDDDHYLIVGHNNVKFILGTKWKHIYFDTNSIRNRKIKSFISDLEKPSICIAGDTISGVVSIGYIEIPKGRGFSSFGMALAKRYKEGVYLISVENTYWLFWFSKGLIFENHGEKKFTSIDECRYFIKNTVLRITPDVVFYGDRYLAPDSINNINVFKDYDIATTITDLRDIKSPFIRKYIPLFYIGFVSLLSISAIIVLYLIIDLYSQSQLEKIKVKEEETKKERFTLDIDKARNKFFSNILNYGKKIPPKYFIESVNQVIGGLPVEYKGWRVNTIKCSVEHEVCSFKWDSINNGTNVEFFQRFKSKRIDFDPSGKIILMEVDLLMPTIDVSDGESVYNQLPDKLTFNNTHISTLQYLQKSNVFTFSVENDKSILDAPATTAAAISDKTIGVIVRKWKMEGHGYYYLVDLAEYLPNVSFSVDTLDITFGAENSADVDWILRGNYVHKN